MTRLRFNILIVGLAGLAFVLLNPVESFGQCQGCIACEEPEPPWMKQCGEVVSGKQECTEYDPCTPESVCHPEGGGCNVPMTSIHRGIELAQWNGPSSLEVINLYGGEALYSGSISLELPPANVPLSGWLAARSPCDQWPPRPLLTDSEKASRARKKSAGSHQ
jgi:hypothetical protein